MLLRSKKISTRSKILLFILSFLFLTITFVQKFLISQKNVISSFSISDFKGKDFLTESETKWSKILNRQSQNLSAAAEEYKRRYKGRLPPKGFDKWWQFTQDHGVKLVDEYDQIFKDLEPFWAIPSYRIRELVEELQNRKNRKSIVYEFTKQRGNFTKTGPSAESPRAEKLLNLIQSFTDYAQDEFLDFKWVIDSEDGAQIRISWKEKDELLKLARNGEVIDLEKHKSLSKGLSWPGSCPINSPAYYSNTTPDRTKLRTLIYDHSKSMDLCMNPDQVQIHGAFMSQLYRTAQSINPIFCFSKSTLDSDILVTPLEQYESIYPDPAYEWKDPNRINQVFWRGSSTGKLLNVTKSINESLKKTVKGKEIKSKNYKFDVEFAGEPIQCSKLVCKKLRKIAKFGEWVEPRISNLYKYALDVDGNGWSGRFHRLLSSNQVVIKSTIFPEWYTDRIQPWFHYVPLKLDYSDLPEIIDYLMNHDNVSEKIARNGKEWAEKFWREEDMAAYMFRLMLEWSRLYNRKNCEMNKKTLRIECPFLDFTMD
ncbi:glycosyl transferase family 90-domain-containing protein [Phakopsora pachyrhizi]|uniref:Glycosyl transferase family 90-domain-containing protein n=1 Tax=Phakopsora pachyrhizi TaxID=170000 RepID=A0AAV0BK98_PHAPC|nr:glycosyl transferase family 90-domain-containing protein [Phakopsora pachyrhizi]